MYLFKHSISTFSTREHTNHSIAMADEDGVFGLCFFCKRHYPQTDDDWFTFACPNCTEIFRAWAAQPDVQHLFDRSLRERPFTQAQLEAIQQPDWRPEFALPDATLPAQHVQWPDLTDTFSHTSPRYAPQTTPSTSLSEQSSRTTTQAMSSPAAMTPTPRARHIYSGSAGSSVSLHGMTYFSPRGASNRVPAVQPHRPSETVHAKTSRAETLRVIQTQRHAQQEHQRRLANMRNAEQPVKLVSQKPLREEVAAQSTKVTNSSSNRLKNPRMICARCGKTKPITDYNDGVTCTDCLRKAEIRKKKEKKVAQEPVVEREMTPVTQNPHAAVRRAGDPLVGKKKNVGA